MHSSETLLCEAAKGPSNLNMPASCFLQAITSRIAFESVFFCVTECLSSEASFWLLNACCWLCVSGLEPPIACKLATPAFECMLVWCLFRDKFEGVIL